MKLLHLAYWRELDHRVKTRLDEITRRPFPAMPTIGGQEWLLRQVTLALAGPFILTPLVTRLLYPWLPQPDWWLYQAAGVTLLCVAYVAHTNYKKLRDATRPVSANPPALEEKA